MIKRVIYSTIALSFAIMPLSNTLAASITEDTTVNITNPITINPDGTTTDTWAADANAKVTNSGGIFTINDYTVPTPNDAGKPNYTQTNDGENVAQLNLNGSSLGLYGTNENSATISAGQVNIATKGDNNSTLTLNSYSGISKAAVITLNANNTLAITTGGSAIITDGTGVTGDTWNGVVTNSGGTLTLDGVTKTTTTASSYTQTSGTLNIGNTDTAAETSAAQSNLNLAAGSSITGGTNSTVNMAQNSTLTLNNGATNSFVLTTNGDTATAANTLVIGDGTTTTTYNAANGTTIGKNPVITINANSTLGLGEGSSVTLSNDASALADTWNGAVNVTSGTLNLDGYTATRGANATLQMSGGNLNHTGTSGLTLGNTGDYISGGTVAIGSDAAQGNTLTISADKGTRDYTLAKAASVTINSGNTLTVTGNGSAILDNTDNWNGTVNVTGGELTLDGVTKTTTETANYTQTAGTLNLGNSGTAAASSLNLATDDSSITGGNVNMYKASTLTLNNGLTNSFALTTDTSANNLVIGDGTTATTYNTAAGTSIVKNAKVTVNSGSTLGLNAGSVTFDSETASADTWNGTVANNGGILTLDGYTTRGANATLQMGSGNLSLTEESELALNHTGDYISGGSVAIGSATDDGNTLTISAAKSGDRAYTLGKNAVVTINEDNTLAISGSGSALIDGADNWNGAISVTGGTITLDGVTKTTTATASYTQTAGTLNLGYTPSGTSDTTPAAAASSLNLATDESSITGGNVNMYKASTLTLNNGSASSFVLTTDDTANSLVIGDSSTFNAADGSSISKSTTVTVNSGATIDLKEGSSLTLSEGDTWSGKIANSGGTLTLDGYEGPTSPTTKPNYTQTAGILGLKNTSTLTLYGADGNYATITGGNVNIGDGTTGSSLTLELGSEIAKAAVINLAAGNTLNVANGKGPGEPSLYLDNGDTWNGTIVFRDSQEVGGGSGIVQLDGFTTRGDSAILDMSEGSISLIGGSSLTLDHTGDYISGGTVSIGTTGTGASTGNSVTISADKGTHDYTLGKYANVRIRSGNTLNIAGNGSAIITDGTGVTGDDWSGTINVTGGELTLDGVTKTTDVNAKYTQTAGILNLGNSETAATKSAAASSLNLATSASSITGGNVNMYNASTLTLNNGLANTFALTTVGDTATASNTIVIGDGTTTTTYNASNGTAVEKYAKVTLNDKSTLSLAEGSNIILNTDKTAGATSGDTWNGIIANNGGTLTLDGFKSSDSRGSSALLQMNSGTLGLIGESSLILGNTGDYIANGAVTIGSDTAEGNILTISAAKSGSRDYTLGKNAVVTINAGNTLSITGTDDVVGSAVLDSGDTWSGTVNLAGGDLTLDGYVTDLSATDAIYTQTSGTLTFNEVVAETGVASGLVIQNVNSYISGGTVNIKTSARAEESTPIANVLAITTAATGKDATLGEGAKVNLEQNAMIGLTGDGNAVLNDIDGTTSTTTSDTWSGAVVVQADVTKDGEGQVVSVSNPILTLKNVHKDFSSVDEEGQKIESATLVQDGGTLNLYANPNEDGLGGSYIVYNETETRDTSYDEETKSSTALSRPYVIVDGVYNDDEELTGVTLKTSEELGKINIQGGEYINPEDPTQIVINTSALQLDYSDDSTSIAPILQNTNMQGNAAVVLNTNGHSLTHTDVIPEGTGADNSLLITGNGSYTINRADADTTLGYNVVVADGSMTANTNKLTIGSQDESSNKYGSLIIGTEGATTQTTFTTNASNIDIYGSMGLYNGQYTVTNPNAYTKIGGDLYTGSGINMMAGAINKIDVAGDMTIDNLDMKIDIDPQSYRSDTINASTVHQNGNLNLSNYNLLSQPTKESYTFKVINASNDDNYTLDAAATKTVTANQTVTTDVGVYSMMPSSVKGAFDLVLTAYNPEVFRGQVAADVIYANQLVTSNMLFDRMVYSNLPYFNGACSNKTAAANTLFSPYQYTTNDTGLWFKPYGNFESIRMTEGIKVDNNAYGALIGADFKKKNFGKGWSFIPTAYVAYNGGYSKYSGNSMWTNGGQGGFMGTFTKKDFVTALQVYAGGYGASYNLASGPTDGNGLWNVGVASKTAYNFHLPWHLILQPTVYLAYNYVGASDINGANGLTIKVDPLNAFNVAPGLNLIWQRDTFSIYAMFQAMFNVNGGASGSVADISLPQIAMRDPYFEYGLGFTKFFKDRYSAYAQGTARSGSRTGFGFQLGLNVKI